MGDRITMTTGTPTPTPNKFNTSYITTCAGTLRILIVVVGIIAIIISSVGSPNDLRSRNRQVETQDDFYGYGLGYDFEPLTDVYLACLIIAWIFSFLFLVVLGFERSHGYAVKMNRLLYCLFGLMILGGVACGGAGTYYFWRGCCNVAVGGIGQSSSRQYLIRQKGYSSSSSTDGPWCRCTFRFQGSGGETYREAFTFNDVIIDSTGQIISAWPHHFVTHCLGLALAFVDGILYIFAACIA